MNILFVCFLFLSQFVMAQINAITENGDEVVLYENGSWNYKSEGKKIEQSEPKVNPKKMIKSSKSTFLLKSSKVNMGIYMDPGKWTTKKASNNEDAEYEFQNKELDIYGMLISEKIQIPLENLRNIAVENAKSVSSDLIVENEEYRTVNGLEVLHIRMKGTIQGIRFIYFGYYYSDKSGTIQFLTYSSEDILNENTELCEDFLNGLVKLK